MKRIWWSIEHITPYLGIPGLLGLALLITALVLELGVRPPLELRHADVVEQITKLDIKQKQPTVAPIEVKNPLAGFSPVNQVPQRLQDIMRLAAAEGLSIPRGQYQAQQPEEGSLDLIRYTISLPMSGSYSAVRRFAAKAKQEIPGLALTQLSFTRENVSTPTPQASVELTLWLTEEAQ